MSGRRRSAVAAVGASAAAAMAAPALVFAANVIFNPSFGHGLHGWRSAVVARGSLSGYPHVSAPRTPVEPLLKCERSQRHHSYLQMDVPGGSAAYVEQSVIVPLNPTHLKFRAWGDLEPVKVTVSIVNGLRVRRLLSFTAPTLRASPIACSKRKPVTESAGVARYAGQAVGVRIEATARGATGTLVDFDSFMLAGR
jgi:hypothetical protein